MKIKEFVLSHSDKFFLHYPICLLITLNCLMEMWQAAITAIIVFILKELYDKYVKKTYISWGDLVADSAGVLTGVILRWIWGS